MAGAPVRLRNAQEIKTNMNLFAPQHLIPILIILLLLFGRGKISELMGDFAKGIKSFKKGLRDDDLVEEERMSAVSGTIGVPDQEETSSPSPEAPSETAVRNSSNSKS